MFTGGQVSFVLKKKFRNEMKWKRRRRIFGFLWQKCFAKKLTRPSWDDRWTVWPDLAKFCYFGTTIKHYGHFESAHLEFAEIMRLFWKICYAIGQIFIGVNTQILKNNLVIWSHSRLRKNNFALDYRCRLYSNF